MKTVADSSTIIAISQFRDVVRLTGLQPPDCIVPGKMHRFPGEGKSRSNRAGWLLLFSDCTGAVFGDWSTGLSEHWQAQRKNPYTAAERSAFKQQVKKARAKAAAERAVVQEVAATHAADLWLNADAAMYHPYLKQKRVLPLGIRQKDNLLVIPLRDADGDIHSCQTIDPAGNKRFISGGKIKGCFYLIGGPMTDQVYIVEGWATGASLHIYGADIGAKGQPIVVAFNAINLKSVAMAIRSKYSDIQITIAADNDHNSRGNTGLTKGREAAALVGGEIIWPNFEDEGFTGTDFNDHVNAGGSI
jgi:putative DNA primase/helicase